MDTLRQFSAKSRSLRHVLSCVLVTFILPVEAGSLERAKRIHDRLTGVPPSSAVLSAMQAKIDANDAIGAAEDAMNNKAFYNATLKNWITPWTNRDDDKFAPLNDYTATVIGVIRDGDDYRKILWDDILYVPNTGAYGAYSNSDNIAYAALEAADGNMGSSSVLDKVSPNNSQSAVTGLASGATAGIMTTRAAARAFFIDGTNRAMFRFTMKNHLCLDLEQVQDTTRPADRIRKDVSRSPGGDSRLFMNTCVGCHNGMDPLAQAFAYYNFAYSGEGNEDSGQLTYRAAANVGHSPDKPLDPATPGGVERKYHINENQFSQGYETLDDRWDNYWRDGPNTAIFGWGAGSGSGTGAKSMGQEFANSRAFAVCSVKKVFKAVCLREPSEADRNASGGFDAMVSNFTTTNNYNLKRTFAEAAVYCSGN